MKPLGENRGNIINYFNLIYLLFSLYSLKTFRLGSLDFLSIPPS